MAAPIVWPNDGLRALKELCLKQEVKREGRLIGFKVSNATFLGIKSEADGFLRIGGSPAWSDGRVIKDKTLIVKYNNDTIQNDEKNKDMVFIGGRSGCLDRMIVRLLCIVGS